ncbi:uncharacterized protein fam83ha [Pholidichthys leucotaenia]
MARRSQCSSAGDNPLNPNYLPPHYREEYRLAIDTLVEEDLEGYYDFLKKEDVVDFLSTPEIQHIQSSVQLPQHIFHPEHHFMDYMEEGSSDTYWPLHSDVDIPDLDLGWPQIHHFIGPAEVTTLVNPPEPDMPSIKEQARRLIKNAQQVIAIAMDMFTDVDIFADILNAAMRNVAVYVLLDEQNAHHFLSMVSNCRVNLQSINFLRVRTVSGITYQCRSGKSFKGQMMNCFLLTDCRAVLSGNYSFMWSFEKLHRCMAHLFLGQLVSTFDEEFRILFAQSQPLMTENVVPPMEDLNVQKRQYPSDRVLMYREPRNIFDTGHPDEWLRPYDERMDTDRRLMHQKRQEPLHGPADYDERMDTDRRLMHHKRQEPLHGPADIYSRFPPQQFNTDPAFDQGPVRMMENPAFKRHAHAEGIHGRYPFLHHQGLHDSETQGRPFYRGQQPYPGAGPGPDYSGYDKFWNQGFISTDQYVEPGLQQEMLPPDNFDPVRNYVPLTKNLDFDQSSEKLPPATDLPFGSSHPRRRSLGQSYACQTSPTPSNPTDQKQFFQEPSTDRKDPKVKRGLRNWRISSYLSTYENPEDEGLPSVPLQEPDPFEEMSNPIQQTAPGTDFSVPKIPNVREFKIPAVPRASQIPSYAKTATQEQPKVLPDEPTIVVTEAKATPTPESSESSSTTELEKTEEVEQKEPVSSALRRDDSFRRKYNAAMPRGSRLRSSFIFSSLGQQNTLQESKNTPPPDQQDEENDKSEAEQTALPFVSQFLGKKKAAAVREPFEWSCYIKPFTETSKPDDGISKADENSSSKEENSKKVSENHKAKESVKPSDVEQTNLLPAVPQFKPSEAVRPKTKQPVQEPKPLLTNPLYVDMSDPDARLMFFKELAAKRKAAEAEKNKEKAQVKPLGDLKNTAVKEEPLPKPPSQKTASKAEDLQKINDTPQTVDNTVATTSVTSITGSSENSEKTKKQNCPVKTDLSTSQSCKEQNKLSAVLETGQLKSDQSAGLLSVSEGTEMLPRKSLKQSHLSDAAVKKGNTFGATTQAKAIPAYGSSLTQGKNESEICHDSSSKESNSGVPCSVKVPPSPILDSKTQTPKSETSISISPQPSGQDSGLGLSFSSSPMRSSSFDHILVHSASQKSPPVVFSAGSHPFPHAGETKVSNIIPKGSSSPPGPSTISSDAQKSVLSQVSSLSADKISQKSENLKNQTHPDSVSQLTTPSAADFTQVECDIAPEVSPAGSKPNTSLLQSTRNSEQSFVPTVSAEESEKVVSKSKIDRGVSETEENVSELERDVPQLVKATDEPGKVSETNTGVYEAEKVVPQSEKSVGESNTNDKGAAESGTAVSKSEVAVTESQMAVNTSEAIVAESEAVTNSEKSVVESKTVVAELETGVSETGKDVAESEKDAAKSEIGESEAIAAKSETTVDSEESVVESEAVVAQSETVVAELGNDVVKPEKAESEMSVAKSEKGVFSLEKDVAESELDRTKTLLCESEISVAKSKTIVLESETGASEIGKDVAESEKDAAKSEIGESEAIAAKSETTVDSEENVVESEAVVAQSETVVAESGNDVVKPEKVESEMSLAKSEKGVFSSEKDVAESELDRTKTLLCESEISVAKSKTIVLESETGASEIGKDVAESEKDAAKSEIGESEAIAAKSETTVDSEENVVESEAVVAQSETVVAESGNDVVKPEKVESEMSVAKSEKGVFSSEKDVAESELDRTKSLLCESEISVAKSKTIVLESETGASEMGKDVAESKKGSAESLSIVSESDIFVVESEPPESQTVVTESEAIVAESESVVSETETPAVVVETEEGISEAGTRVTESEKDAAEPESILSESETLVSESDTVGGESEILVGEREAIVLETEKGVSGTGKDAFKSEKIVAKSETAIAKLKTVVSESEINVEETEIDASECKAGVSQSENDVSELETDLSKMKKDATESVKTVSESEKEEFVVIDSSEAVKGDGIPSSLSPSLPESCLPGVSGVESSVFQPDLKKAITPLPSQSDSSVSAPAEHLVSKTSSPINTDSTHIPAQLLQTASPQDTLLQESPRSNHSLTGFGEPMPAETVSPCAPLSESVGSVLCPEADKTEINMSVLNTCSDVDSVSSEIPAESVKALIKPPAESSSTSTEPTSEVTAEVDLACKLTESVTSASQTSEIPKPSENSKAEPELMDTVEKKLADTKDTNKVQETSTQESVSSEKVINQIRRSNSSEPADITYKQPKSNQSRYHPSTANVLSSSNLRDDTKLLLEQISANSHSRNDATKDSPVTDDEKEDKADKKMNEKAIRSYSRFQPKPTQDKDKLLERIQNMRKDRKVYSRFEL